MTQTKLALALLAMILVQACTPPDRYPVSKETCAPDDPVLDLTIANCTPPV